MKLGFNICSNDILTEFEQDSGPLENMTEFKNSFVNKNMAARGGVINPYMALVKMFLQSRGHILPKFHETCPN